MQYVQIYFFFLWRCRPTRARASSFLRFSRSRTTTHHRRWDSSGRVINPSQRPLPDDTQYSQHTNIHAPGGIRTHDLSTRAAADLRLRPRGHCDRQYVQMCCLIVSVASCLLTLVELLDMFERFNHCSTFVCTLLFHIQSSSSCSVRLASI